MYFLAHCCGATAKTGVPFAREFVAELLIWCMTINGCERLNFSTLRDHSVRLVPETCFQSEITDFRYAIHSNLATDSLLFHPCPCRMASN